MAFRERAGGRPGLVSTALLLALAATILVSGVLTADSLDLYAWDFRVQYLRGAEALVGGEPLYGDADEIVADAAVLPYAMPPLTAVLLVPVTYLPIGVAVVLALLASVGAVLGALALVGVRDVRCYLAVVASAPAWNLLETANVTAALVLGLALAWRMRSRLWPLAVVLGAMVALKLLTWPLVVWAAARRLGAGLAAVAVFAAVTLAAWTAVRFEGFWALPGLLARLEEVWGPVSYSFVGLAAALGLDAWAGRALALGAGAALLGLALALRADEARSFACGVAAALALSPIVWVHYLLLFLVPLGVLRPRFSWLWLLPLATWLSPRTGHGDGIEPFVPAVVAVLLVAGMLAGPRRLRPEAGAPA